MELTKRKPNRLKAYDYSQNGIYFLTICTAEKRPILSKIENSSGIVSNNLFRTDSVDSQNSHHIVGANCVRLSKIGEIVENEIRKINFVYDNVCVDNYVIMPNHIHLMIRLNSRVDVQNAPTISRIVKQFKGSITKQLGRSIWQKSYYDHIIRDDVDYNTKWQYIDENPIKWTDDELYQQ